MNRHIKILALIFALLIPTFSCSSEPAARSSLSDKLAMYKKSFKAKDYIGMSSFVLPSIVEEAGGVDGFVLLMQSLVDLLAEVGMTMDPADMEFGAPGPIVSHEDVLVSVIPTEVGITIQGQAGSINASVVGFSQDGGETWFFIEGSDEGRAAIAEVAPEVLQKVEIPTTTMTVGDTTLVQQNGAWVEE